MQGLISVAFLLFILLTSNPFERLSPAPFEGRDLNPILQDPGLAIHPPMLYLGYVGFSIVFSFAAAALIEGRIDAAWARFVRPFALVAWSLLTLGIAAGSFWAYYTLGWGGFWFWDPVENASLMPWLAGTAFVHSVAVMEKRDALKVWTIFLAIVAFSFSLLGTFLVRSGVLTSVHAFASDPRRGVFILAILALFILGSFALFAWRAPMLRQGGLFAPVSREGALVLNNLLLTTSCATVLFGTLYPLALEQLTGEKITVGAPFFNMTCGVLLLTAAFATPIGFSLAWKRGDLLGVAQRLTVALAAGAIVAIAGAAWLHGQSILAAIAAGDRGLRHRRHADRDSHAGLAARAFAGRGAEAGGGAAAVVLGRGAGAYRRRRDPARARRRRLRRRGDRDPAQGRSPGGRTLRDHARTRSASASARITRKSVAPMTVRSGGSVVATIEPARRQFAARQMTTTEAGLATLHFGQVYVSIGDPAPDGAVPARLYWKPLVTLIWLGGAAMALGGALSLADRRLRFGVAVRARAARRSPQGRADSMRRLRLALAFLLFALLAAPSFAVQPDEVMKDPALEARARALSEGLRCMVCQNQSIDDSDAPLARDIRASDPPAHRAGRKQRRGSRLSRLALRRFHPPEAAVQAGDVALVAQRPADALRRPRCGPSRPSPRAARIASSERTGGSAARGADQEGGQLGRVHRSSRRNAGSGRPRHFCVDRKIFPYQISHGATVSTNLINTIYDTQARALLERPKNVV